MKLPDQFPVDETNLRLFLATTLTGRGPVDLQDFMEVCDLPTYNAHLFSDLNKHVAPVLQELRIDSHHAAAEEEARLSAKAGKPVVEIGEKAFQSVTVSVDGHWHHCRNSQAGGTDVIGTETGKILAHELLSTDCYVCSLYNRVGKDPPEHQCVKNYSGTPQSMETSAAIPAMQSLHNYGIHASEIVGDCDSKTIAALRARGFALYCI